MEELAPATALLPHLMLCSIPRLPGEIPFTIYFLYTGAWARITLEILDRCTSS